MRLFRFNIFNEDGEFLGQVDIKAFHMQDGVMNALALFQNGFTAVFP
jgi:negative regulator of sigma E activity